jgi:hypothetical protein
MAVAMQWSQMAVLTFEFDDKDKLTSYKMTKQLVGP